MLLGSAAAIRPAPIRCSVGKLAIPFGVSLAQGYPRFGPGEYTAQLLLERREVDAALLIGAQPSAFSAEAQDHLASIPWIYLGSQLLQAFSAQVAIQTAALGVAAGGTVHRLDDVPLSLRPVVSSLLPSEEGVLASIERSGQRAAGSRQ